MSKTQAVKVLERRLAHLVKQVETGYYSKGRSEHWVHAEVSALRLAIKALLMAALLLPACSDTCGRVEGPALVLDAKGPTGCWAYTGEPRCAPALVDEGPCVEQRKVFHTGDKLVLWCDAEVVAPKAVMVPVECK